MATLKKFINISECSVALFITGSLIYVVLRDLPSKGTLHQDIFLKQVVNTGKVLFNLYELPFIAAFFNPGCGIWQLSKQICQWFFTDSPYLKLVFILYPHFEAYFIIHIKYTHFKCILYLFSMM